MKLLKPLTLLLRLNGFVFLLLFFYFNSYRLSAQSFSKIIRDTLSQKSKIRIALRYSSDYYFMGRNDSVRAPYITPALGYYHKSGLFINSSLSYLTNPDDARVDLIKISGGYDYSKNKFEAGVSLSQNFFSDSSFVVQSEMNTYLYAYAGYDLKLLMIYLDGGLGFSSSTDAFVGLELNHTFYAFRNKFRIIPALYLNAGTQKYYAEYYVNRSSQNPSKGKGKGSQQGSNTSVYESTESSKFEILDYEADIQFVYVINKFRFFMAPTWLFPVNPASIKTTNAVYTEDLKNGFYLIAGLRVSI